MNGNVKRGVLAALSIAFMAGGGCQTPQSPLAVAATSKEQIRVNCYSLLHQLLDEQRNVDKLLLIKRESEELHRLIKAVATASSAGAERLESLAASDASLNLQANPLPAGERATRDAIARTKARELLTPFNPNFELDLLLVQSEALSYAWHLAKVASENEREPARARYLSGLGDEMRELLRQAHALMRARLSAPKLNGI